MPEGPNPLQQAIVELARSIGWPETVSSRAIARKAGLSPESVQRFLSGRNDITTHKLVKLLPALAALSPRPRERVIVDLTIDATPKLRLTR